MGPAICLHVVFAQQTRKILGAFFSFSHRYSSSGEQNLLLSLYWCLVPSSSRSNRKSDKRYDFQEIIHLMSFSVQRGTVGGTGLFYLIFIPLCGTILLATSTASQQDSKTTTHRKIFAVDQPAHGRQRFCCCFFRCSSPFPLHFQFNSAQHSGCSLRPQLYLCCSITIEWCRMRDLFRQGVPSCGGVVESRDPVYEHVCRLDAGTR